MFKHDKRDEIIKLKKRLEELDKKIDSKFNELHKTFLETRHAMLKMRDERKKLLREKTQIESDLLVLIDKLNVNTEERNIGSHVVEKMRGELKEDVELVKKIVHEDINAPINDDKILIQKKKPAKSADETKEDIEFMHSIAKAATEDKVSTPLDKLYEYVSSHGKVRINEAARQFEVSEEQIEDWARILEVRNLIEIYYPAFGKPELRKKK
jgi:hypothetical protein